MICAKEIIMEKESKINANGGNGQPLAYNLAGAVVGGGGSGGGGGTVIIVTKTSLTDNGVTVMAFRFTKV